MGWSVTDGLVVVSGRPDAANVTREGTIRARFVKTPGGLRVDGDDVEAAARGLRLWMHRRALEGAAEAVRVQARGAVLDRAGLEPSGLARVPAVERSDGVVRIRPLREADLEADLAAKDDAQIRWMWTEEEAACWMAMSSEARRAHALEGLRARAEAFGAGPKWCFAADADASYVAYVDVDLANPNAPAGDANIAYSAHPAHRGRGYVARAVRLTLEFLALHTGCQRAHILVDVDNEPSLRVARSVCRVEPVPELEGRLRFTVPTRKTR
ncbi:MAG: GNAT family protein [Myxococcota bacterium]